MEYLWEFLIHSNKPKIIFSDFDGTLTSNGMMSPIFFDVLNRIEQIDIPFVIVSGRSLSWGHFFLTHFPLDAVIMEGGGVILLNQDGRIVEKKLVSQTRIDHLIDITKKISDEYGIECTEDSFGRLTDRAIDLRDLDDTKEERLERIFQENGIQYSKSNVHLNFWCGQISKALACEEYLKSNHPELSFDDCLFFGDAMNDQTMFKEVKHSVGVSNISKCWDQMEYHPSIRLQGSENEEILGVANYLEKLEK